MATDLPRTAARPRADASPTPLIRPSRPRLRVRGGGRITLAPLPPEPAARLAAEERERREHIRRWAKLMIVHLERADFDAGYTGYVETLERLRELLAREIRHTHAEAAR